MEVVNNNGGSREEGNENIFVRGIKTTILAVSSKTKKGSRWFWSDLKQSHLIWLKLIFFFQSASMVVLYPYLVIHMRSLGLSVEEVAIVNTVVPAADIVGPTLAGFIADKIGNFRIFMAGLTALGGLSSVLILLVPAKSGRETATYCCNYTESSILDTLYCAKNVSSYIENESSSLFKTSSHSSLSSCDFDNLTRQLNLTNIAFGDENIEDVCEYTCTTSSEGVEWDRILWFYIALRAILDILRASSLMMFEGAVVVTIKQLGGDYGLQKLFGTFGAIIWGPISGIIIDHMSNLHGTEDYSSVFYLFCGMRLICALLILKLDLKFKPPAKKVFKDICKLILRPHMTIFLLMFFICGSLWGLLETYFFWFLQDLGSTKFTMGISLAIGTVAGIPLTISSGAILKYLGQVNVVALSLFLYFVRLLGYSFITTPEYSLIFEVLKPFGNSLLMIAAMTYAKDNATITTMASLEGIMGALYFGVGKALGGLLGGLAIDSLGERTTFRIFSGLALISSLAYFLFNYFYKRRKSGNMEVKDDPENTKNSKTTFRSCESDTPREENGQTSIEKEAADNQST